MARRSKPVEGSPVGRLSASADRIDDADVVTLRHDIRLHHIKVGRPHAGTRVLMLVAELDIRIVNETGELLRSLTLDPSKAYQPLGMDEVQGCPETGVNDVSRHHKVEVGVWEFTG